MNRLRVVSAAVVAFLWAVPVLAETASIRPEPSGKRLLFIDGNDLRSEPGGKRLLFIDGDNIRDEPNGKRLLFIDGDNVRPDPHGIRLAFIDGKNIRRTPNGKRLLFIDGPNIRPDPNGKRLLFVDGNVTKQQLVAALYLLKPEIFKLTKEEEATLKAEMKANEAESDKQFNDVLVGKFDVVNSSVGDWSGGEVTTFKGKDDFYYLDLKLKKQSLAGIGVKRPGPGWDEIWMAFAPEGAVALAVYDIDKGKLTGRWVPINAAKDGKETLGTETLEGPANLDGDFKIVDAKAPNNGAAYAGTVSIHPHTPNGNSSDLFDTFTFTWNFGATKIPGVAAKMKHSNGKLSLIVASGTKENFAVGHVSCQSATNSKGIDFMNNKGEMGYIVWTKQQ